MTLQGTRSATVRIIDGIVVCWLLIWLVAAVATGNAIWKGSELGDTVVTAGQTLDDAGKALGELDDVPFVGDRTAEFARDVQTKAADVVARGEQTKQRIRQVAVLAGVGMFVVPIAPVLALYLPGRLRRHRDVRAVRAALSRPGGYAAIQPLLARLAVVTVPLHELLRHVPDLEGPDPGAGTAVLAEAYLRRLGVKTAAQGDSGSARQRAAEHLPGEQ